MKMLGEIQIQKSDYIADQGFDRAQQYALP